MRFAWMGLFCIAALAAACSPPVGSEEWCNTVIREGLAKVAQLPRDQQDAAGKCAADAMRKGLSDAMGKMTAQ